MLQMKVSEFSYELPERLVAQQPPKVRGTSRLLVLHRDNGLLEHRKYTDFINFIQPGDVVVLNDTKVIKARLLATNNSGQKRELLLLEDHHNTDLSKRRCLYRGTIKTGEILDVDGTLVTITKVFDGGIAEVRAEINLLELADKDGTVPLPPYMRREASAEDVKRYQTVFARQAGSVAAPTASLNITQELLDAIVAKGATVSYLTLHVGLGTFLPIRSDDIEHHDMHSEYFEIPKSTVQAIQKAKKSGQRVIAVGTTVARTLEFAHATGPVTHKVKPSTEGRNVIYGEADIFIYPGYEFKVVDALLTNFHAPKSTVLMLAAAFTGWDNLKIAYQEAIKEEYAFLSYGDSMLII